MPNDSSALISRPVNVCTTDRTVPLTATLSEIRIGRSVSPLKSSSASFSSNVSVRLKFVRPRISGITAMEKALSVSARRPSVTVIEMSSTEPILEAVGLPDSVPVASSNVAQIGRLSMLNVSGSFSGSEAVGKKL